MLSDLSETNRFAGLRLIEMRTNVEDGLKRAGGRCTTGRYKFAARARMVGGLGRRARAIEVGK